MNETRYMHLRVGRGFVTVAISGGFVGLAWCSPEDQFSRKRGRQIAEGRLRKRPQYLGTTDKEEIRQHVSLALACESSPEWTWEYMDGPTEAVRM